MKFIIPLIGSLFIRALHATLRVRHVNAENIERTPQYILAFWHAHLLLMLHCRFRRPIWVMSSRSKDGDIMVRVYSWYGVQSARGSTTRGGEAALRTLIRAARAGANLVFTPDGPRGPARIVQPGLIHSARVTGLPVIPIAFAAQKKNFSARGTAWSCRCRSRRRSTSTVPRSTLRVTRTSTMRSCASQKRSMPSPKRQNGS